MLKPRFKQLRCRLLSDPMRISSIKEDGIQMDLIQSKIWIFFQKDLILLEHVNQENLLCFAIKHFALARLKQLDGQIRFLNSATLLGGSAGAFGTFLSSKFGLSHQRTQKRTRGFAWAPTSMFSLL